MQVLEAFKEDILERDVKGKIMFQEFVSDRIVESSAKKSIWDPMRKAKLKTFSSCRKKTQCKIGAKLVKLREDRQKLARFLVVQQSRPGMIHSLGDTIGKYEFSVIPRSLFTSDGLLLIPSDKSSFIHAIETYGTEPNSQSEDQINEQQDSPNIETSGEDKKTDKLCIIDTMAVVQAIKKSPSMVDCSDFAAAFVRSIRKIASQYDEARVIFDRYIDDSLKAQTRGKRTAGIEPVKFDIKDNTNIKLVSLKTLLSHNYTKSQLTEYLGKAVLHEYTNSSKNVVVVYGNATYSNKPDMFDPELTHHTHPDSESDDSETMTFVRSGGSLSLPREVLNIANQQSSDQLAIYRARYPSLASLYSALEEESISRINTDVMATKILGIDEAFFKDLIEPVVGIYKHQELGANLNPSCVFLDLDQTSGEESESWKATGCEVYASNETHTTCHCYHLTNFAVIMDVHGVQSSLSNGHETALSIISQIGGSVSIVGCVTSVAVYEFFRLKSDRIRVHENLGVAIAISQLIFLVGMERTDIVWLCKAVAIAFHYAITAMFCWMLLEGVHLYVMLVKEFGTGRMVKKYLLAGWGIPLIVAGVSAGIFYKEYALGNV
eukprot:XP_011670959.1 PREDICTED: EGF, latrophilin and seven transmembrane domain-containing protein 1-like [Strongylocentrotus purpuratus]